MGFGGQAQPFPQQGIAPLPINTALPPPIQGQGPTSPAPGQAPAPAPSAPPQVAQAAQAPSFQSWLQSVYGPNIAWTQAGAPGGLMNTGPRGNFQSAGDPTFGTMWTGVNPNINMGKPLYVAGPTSLSSPYAALPVPLGEGEREGRG